MLLFHATSYDSYIKIKKDGFLNPEHEEKLWNCSEDNLYFYTEEHFRSEHDIDGEDEESLFNCAFYELSSQADIALSNPETEIYKRVIFVIDSKDLKEDLIEPDTSCPHMEYCVSYPSKISLSKTRIFIDKENLEDLKHYFWGIMREAEFKIDYELSEIAEMMVEGIKENSGIWELITEKIDNFDCFEEVEL